MSSPPRTVLRTLPVVPNGTRQRVPATPRKHKTPAPDRLLGVKPLKETLQEIKNKTREHLKLNFDIDYWQGELIRRLRQGYDSLMIAGTGYGKSIIFVALAALNKSKIVIVICPLKPRVGWLPIKIPTRCLTIGIGHSKRKKRKSRMERVRKVSRENTSWHWI
ncbi:hypothetical protein B0H10DRAFT_2187778 [Mycena sp. CBHHK59/15]|nr:hypothetical protein B0H10DRAFT_2187778 [Mycena sp. CBHHK59/15]